MSTNEKKNNWSVEDLKRRWTALVEGVADREEMEMPVKRLRYQAEIEASFEDIVDAWEGMNDEARADAWTRLGMSLEGASREMLPMCVQCGQCCTKGSPTLMEDDLELLQIQSIPWNRLVTFRKGEPAHSPFTDDVFYLEKEHIKVREIPGTKTCVFFDAETFDCRIHRDRPMQCRAQECWDEEPGKLLAQQPTLTRAMIFKPVELLQEMIEEHDRQFSFEVLRQLFDELKESEGETADKVVEFLAKEDLYRSFVAEKLTIPSDVLDLVFGRPLSSMVRLFGFRVDEANDGTKTLRPDDNTASKG